jgi:hypothetical protein
VTFEKVYVILSFLLRFRTVPLETFLGVANLGYL